MSIPIGTIMPYGGNVKSGRAKEKLRKQGWLVCDGEDCDVTDYPDLFDVIRFSFGGDGANTFRLPDLRGRFIRGVDHGQGNDPDAKERDPSAEGGSKGDKVGSLQEDTFKRHLHKIEIKVMSATKGGKHSGGDWGKYNIDSTLEEGDNETRPKNIYVNFIIRAMDV